jgi:hypothetical protein
VLTAAFGFKRGRAEIEKSKTCLFQPFEHLGRTFVRKRTIAVFGVLSMALVASGAAQAEQFVNAHYEINVNDGDSKSSVRSAFRVKPGESERLELDPNVVELTVQPASDREYDL